MKVRLKVGALLLAAALTASIGLSACGTPDEAFSEKPGSSQAVSSASSQGESSATSVSNGESVALTALMIKHPLMKDLNEMQWLNELQERTGVTIEWQQINADWDQKKSPMFMSGEIPDILINATATTDYATYPGLFEDIGPLIEEYAPNISEMFEKHPETKFLATQLDGKIYATPKYQAIWPKTNTTMFINRKWLDAVNMEIPTTWDELYEVLKAFRDTDANGNGDMSDEIPMDFNGIGNAAYSPQLLLGSLGMQLTDLADLGFFAEDATVKNFFVDERFKTLVVYLQKLYGEGLINTETINNISDYSKFQSIARGNGDVASVGFTWGWEVTDRFGNELADQYTAIPQLKYSADADYDLRWQNDYYALNYSPNRAVISSDCQNKEAAMRFIDGFYDPVTSMEVLMGGRNEQDKGIAQNDDGSWYVLPPADPAMDPGSWKWTNAFAGSGPLWLREDIPFTLGTDMTTVLEEKALYEDLLSKADPKKDLYPQSFMKYTDEENNTLAMTQANIKNIVDTQWALWMTGSGDIEAEWDSYVQSVQAAGLDEVLGIRQKAFEEYLASMD